MAPAWVLLDRLVDFDYDSSVFDGASEEGGGKKPRTSEEPRRTHQWMREARIAFLETMKPDVRVADLPQLSSLRILRPTRSITLPPLAGPMYSGHVASADKNLVALYAGNYRTDSYSTACFLIYDAESNSLSAIPGPDIQNGIGCGAVVLRDGHGYALAELVVIEDSEPDEARLLLWRSSTAEWVIKAGRPPRELVEDFIGSMCFSSGGSILCWVDLLQGMVVCDLQEQEHKCDPGFHFVRLPDDCPTYPHTYQKPLLPEAFRSMASVGGAIKFVSMDGYAEGRPGDEMTLTMWTLSADLCHWKEGKHYSVRDIWESDTHRSLGLPRIIPLFPVLSINEEDVVYLVCTDASLVDGEVQYKDQYFLRVDMGQREVKCLPGSTGRIFYQPLACEFSAYLQGLE